ncbi:MAG: peptide deformylase [Anaerolineales bacterium]|nr:peptide deformylase [Anaerolineales bacterium]
MALREIVIVPNPVLRKKAKEITDFGIEFQTLVDDMVETMREAPGVGLAAPQVGVLQRLITIEYAENENDDDATPKLYVVANPEIKKYTLDTEMGFEGCLSIPNLVGDVERKYGVTVKGQNRHGQKITIKARGWMARIFQHEIDHLDGVLFTDKAVEIRPLQPDEEIRDV